MLAQENKESKPSIIAKTKSDLPVQKKANLDPIDDLDLLDLNEEEIDNIPIRIWIQLDPSDDNHKGINLKEMFQIQNAIYIDFNIKDDWTC